jgi:Phosphate acetyl/butaryl transferase
MTGPQIRSAQRVSAIICFAPNRRKCVLPRTKGITSLVAGRADILVVLNLESGNMLAKELVFVAHAHGAGLVVGANVPIILTSHADAENTRLASCAIGALYRHAGAIRTSEVAMDRLAAA